MQKDWLPSKKFVKSLGIVVISIIVVLFLTKWKDIFKEKIRNSNIKTFSDALNKDSNNNGIFDYEEKLWGLDPYSNGEQNAKIVEEKRALYKTLVDNSVPTENGGYSNQTDTTAEELGQTLAALDDTDSLNEESVNQIGQTIGKNIQTKAVLVPKYARENIVISGNIDNSGKKYFQTLSATINSYVDDTDNELSVINSATTTKDQTSIDQLKKIGKSYQSLSQKIISIKTPTELVDQNLALANSLFNVGDGLLLIANSINDPLLGVVGIEKYKNAGTIFSDTYNSLAQTLISRGIIIQ